MQHMPAAKSAMGCLPVAETLCQSLTTALRMKCTICADAEIAVLELPLRRCKAAECSAERVTKLGPQFGLVHASAIPSRRWEVSIGGGSWPVTKLQIALTHSQTWLATEQWSSMCEMVSIWAGH